LNDEFGGSGDDAIHKLEDDGFDDFHALTLLLFVVNTVYELHNDTDNNNVGIDINSEFIILMIMVMVDGSCIYFTNYTY